MAATVDAGSWTGASWTTKTLPSNSSSRSAASRSARRVLPTPPGPVSVSSRSSRTRATSRASSSRAPDELRGLGRQATGRGRAGPGPGSAAAWVVGQDAGLELAQRGGRLEAELLAQDRPQRRRPAERLGGPAAAVQRDDQLVPEALAERGLRDQRLELADQLGVLAAREPGLEQVLAGVGAQLVEAHRFVAGPVELGELLERRPSPAVERGVELCRPLPGIGHGPGGRAQALEPLGVDCALGHLEQVARWPSDDVGLGPEELAQPRQLALQDGGRVGRRLGRPTARRRAVRSTRRRRAGRPGTPAPGAASAHRSGPADRRAPPRCSPAPGSRAAPPRPEVLQARLQAACRALQGAVRAVAGGSHGTGAASSVREADG